MGFIDEADSEQTEVGRVCYHLKHHKVQWLMVMIMMMRRRKVIPFNPYVSSSLFWLLYKSIVNFCLYSIRLEGLFNVFLAYIILSDVIKKRNGSVQTSLLSRSFRSIENAVNLLNFRKEITTFHLKKLKQTHVLISQFMVSVWLRDRGDKACKQSFPSPL